MTTTTAMRVFSLAVLIGIVTLVSLAAAAFASAQTTETDEWGRQTADALEGFLPQPVSGLTERFPWDRLDFNHVVKGWGCGECPTYLPVDASRSWRIADPSAIREHESLTRQQEDLVRRAQEKGKRATMQEMMEIQNKLTPLVEKERKIQLSSRSVEVRLRANLTAQDRIGVNAKPVGNIKGYPFYRRPAPNDIHLTVYVGPQGFKNPDLPRGQKPKTELKCVIIEVQLHSNPSSLKGDEALARQMLEKIDFTSLAKLIRP